MSIQGLFIFLSALAVISIFTERNSFLVVYVALYLGPYQVLISIIDILRKGQDSKLIGHFLLSVVYIVAWYLCEEFGGYHVEAFLEDTWFGQLLIFAPPALLATYHWYITFTRFNPIKPLPRPHVFDL